MMYPDTFERVVGHEVPIRALQSAYRSERLHHAYLFQGSDGIGKRRVARALAALLQCEAAQAQPERTDACGECRACRNVAVGSHPDVQIIEPDGRFIKIDQVRALQQQTRFRPYEGTKRVFIIDGAERMREEAANALLKTLEEPGGQSMFCVISAQPQLLLSTVRSRCQPLRFAPLSTASVVEVLVGLQSDKREGGGVATGVREGAAAASGGSVARALQLLESPVFQRRDELLGQVLSLQWSRAGDVLDLAQSLAARRDELDDVLDLLLLVYRDASLLAAGAGDAQRNAAGLEALVDELSSASTPSALVSVVEAITRTRRWLQGNVNARMVMERLLLDIVAARRPDGALAQRPA